MIEFYNNHGIVWSVLVPILFHPSLKETTVSTAITVYQESVRRIELMISVIGLRAIYSQVPINIAQSMIGAYAINLRKLKIEFNYTGGDNTDYGRLHCEFTLGEDPTDLGYDLAHVPSTISHLEATSLMAERIQLLLQSELYSSGEVC